MIIVLDNSNVLRYWPINIFAEEIIPSIKRIKHNKHTVKKQYFLKINQLLGPFTVGWTFKSEEDFNERFDVPVLGNIPDFAKAKSGKYYKNYKYYGKGGNK